ncbi:MAG: TylF/MycF/NovP-related O-methyltransferase [Cyanobacteriota bacterium]|nr:TylF/MycF/NovP-related O-methyltransferase [Cyanobacteriota bacterium]
MLGLKETLEHQKNLAILCADRPQITQELFRANAYYGIDYIIKKYSKLPLEYSLKTIIPHGVSLSEDKVWEAEVNSNFPVLWTYPDYRKAAYCRALQHHRRTNKKVISGASPFLYLLHLLKNHSQPKRQGTIFFPFHSTHHITVKMDDDSLAEELKNLDPKYYPVRVCIYWKDFLLKRHLPYQKRGLEIVSAGHAYDRNFLFRFYHLCSMHRYAASNELGSHLFYAVKSGCSYFSIGSEQLSFVGDPTVLKDLAFTPKTRQVQLKSLFCEPQPRTTTEQMQVIDYYLGTNHMKSSDELRQQLLEAEELFKNQQVRVVLDRAVENLNSKNDSVALRAIEQALTLQPQEIGLNYGKAIALSRLERKDEAITVLNDLLKCVPEHQKAKFLHAEILSESVLNLREQAIRALNENQNEEAFSYLNRAKSFKQPISGLDYLRSIYFLRQNQASSALQALQEELRYFPNHREARTLFDRLVSQFPQLHTPQINDREFQELLQTIRPYTMLGEARLYSLFCLVKRVCLNNIPGNIIECGVAGGGSTALMATVIKRYTKQPRWLYAFDSFEGMPTPTQEDKHNGVSADATGWGTGTCAASETNVRQLCEKLGVSDIVKTVKGYFQDTLPEMRDMVGTISLLHMDGDWYESTQAILENLYDRVVNDGLIQVDDYGYWEGCRQAVGEFEASRNLKFAIQTIDDTGVWFVKPDRFPINSGIEPTLLQEFAQDDPVGRGIQSQMSINERFQLYYTLRKLLPQASSPLRFIEIGSYAGSSLFLMYGALKKVAPQLQGFAIDPGVHPQLLQVLQHLQNEVAHLRMFSHHAAPRLKEFFNRDGNRPAFILVDGDHTYEGVKQDILNYYPLLAPGGIMLFHDYLPSLDEENREAILFHHAGNEPGIRQACQELMENTYGCEAIELPLLYPTDPTQTQAHLPIIPGVFSTIRVYRKPQ